MRSSSRLPSFVMKWAIIAMNAKLLLDVQASSEMLILPSTLFWKMPVSVLADKENQR
jgi:hypothetical protein